MTCAPCALLSRRPSPAGTCWKSPGNAYQRRTLSDGASCEVLKNFPSEEELRQELDGLATQVKVGLLPNFWVLTYVPQVER
jgi:hypothetical protein